METVNALAPHSLEAEHQVLGAILYNATAMADVADILEPEDFYRGPHQHIYAAFQDLFRKGEPVEYVHTIEWLKDNEALEAAGGEVYVMDLAMAVTTAAAVRYHAEIIRNHSLRRKLQWLGRELVVTAQTESGSDALEFIQSQLLGIAQSNDRQKDMGSKELAQVALKNIMRRLECPSHVDGIPTGFPKLDQFIDGLRPSKLIILGARPGMGKSGFALNMAVNVAVHQKRPVLFFSLEMEPEELMERALMTLADSPNSVSKLEMAARQIPNTLKIIDRPNLNSTQLRACIIKNKLEMGDLGLIVVDYLQLMKGTGNNRVEEITSISRDLKLISREFKVPVVALSQLSRGVESRQDKRPLMSDLRESGSIEQDADLVMFIYRDEYYSPNTTEKPRVAEIIIGKNRGGRMGAFDLLFNASTVKFIDTDARREARYDAKAEVVA